MDSVLILVTLISFIPELYCSTKKGTEVAINFLTLAEYSYYTQSYEDAANIRSFNVKFLIYMYL